MNPITIPVECLAILGGMKEGDPAMVSTSGVATSWQQWARWRAGKRLLVAESDGLLLRVLCRHLGWLGVHRPALQLGKRGTELQWRLITHNRHGVWPGATGWRMWLPEHIGVTIDYHEALAAAVVHYARIAGNVEERRQG